MNRTTKNIVTIACGLAALLASAIGLADVTLPHKFTAGTTIKASEVNADLDALNTGKQDKLATFIHIATPSNISNNYTIIDNPATNGKPNAILVVTPNRTPAGGTAPFYSGSISVSYANGKWYILHDAGPSQPIQDKEAFNVLVLGG